MLERFPRLERIVSPIKTVRGVAIFLVWASIGAQLADWYLEVGLKQKKTCQLMDSNEAVPFDTYWPMERSFQGLRDLCKEKYGIDLTTEEIAASLSLSVAHGTEVPPELIKETLVHETIGRQ
ncbi:MAG: hypothetical protein WCT53_02450 [Candidatus Gracilibacteria bacterium]